MIFFYCKLCLKCTTDPAKLCHVFVVVYIFVFVFCIVVLFFEIFLSIKMVISLDHMMYFICGFHHVTESNCKQQMFSSKIHMFTSGR